MKVVWFEVSQPGLYNGTGTIITGWQDSLQKIIMRHPEVELYIAFEGNESMSTKYMDGIHYIPLVPRYSFSEKKVLKYYDRKLVVSKLLPLFVNTVRDINPDVIHIFGTEWGLGEITNYTSIPVVCHMMGSVTPYLNALFPPGYNFFDEFRHVLFNPLALYRLMRNRHYYKTWLTAERDNFKAVKYYMGRTTWDSNICQLFHPGCEYFYCSEALRPSFMSNTVNWRKPVNSKLQLLTTGCSTHWKGMDMLLKTARILKEHEVNFEWHVVGNMPKSLKRVIESKEKVYFSDCNVNFLGVVNSDKLLSLLLASNIYIHTAYIDNSPNSICEAQYIGLPIIATYVGGIPSLIDNGKEGLLVPANDPFTMAQEIMSLAKDDERQNLYSHFSQKRAKDRHNPEHIFLDLMKCYNTIIENGNK